MSPEGVAFDSNTNTLYISDTGNDRVMKYEQNARSGTLVAGGNGPGTNTNQLYSPRGLHFEGATNTLLIANTGANNVVRWKLGDSNWTHIGGRLDGSNGTESNELHFPMDVISDRIGNIYVADSGNSRVQLYLVNHTDAATVTSFTYLTLLLPPSIYVASSIALDDQMNLYVADMATGEVQQFKRY